MHVQENDDNRVLNIIYEVLDSFGGTSYNSKSGELRRNGKLFGLILDKEIYLRIKPQFFFFYPRETYGYYELRLKKFKLKEPIDKEELLCNIYRAYLIAYEDGPYLFDKLNP